mmetsp:Transcript_3844/g.13175  ORF Transcript_3844/g.13175 Transcript_3844/m.13175 type:complete len:460 (-) Transcript_3844:112-1491(-)
MCFLAAAALVAASALTAAADVRSVLVRIGVRGAALRRLAERAAKAPGGMSASAAALEQSISELDAAGLAPDRLAKLLARQPRALPPLLSHSPAALLAALRDTKGLPPAAQLIAAEPLLLTLDDVKLRAALDYLEPFVCAANRSAAEFVARQPQALLWRAEASSPVLETLREMGLDQRAVDRVSRWSPARQLASGDGARRSLSWLGRTLGLEAAALGRLVASFPPVVGLEPARLAASHAFLASEAGEAAAVAALVRYPQLLSVSVEANLRPTADYLRLLGVDVGRVVRSHAITLDLSLEANLKPTVSFLQREGVEELGRVLSSQPSLLSLSTQSSLAPKCDFLRSLGMAPLGPLLTQYPAVLTLSLEANLRPTALALAEAGVLSPPDPTLRPRHLAASLERRIKPRLALCAALGVTPTLGAVTTASDVHFCKQVRLSPRTDEVMNDLTNSSSCSGRPPAR